MNQSVSVSGTSYKILEKLGTGGYSSVYRVSDPLNRSFALKKIETTHINEAELIAGFKREVALLKKLKDEPKVIQYIASEELDKLVYVVMELGDLDLDTIIHKGRKLKLSEVRHYSFEIFKCVQAIHMYGIVHSDLKPANFICVKGSLKLIDFGLSDTPQGHTVSVYRSNAIGTLSYMAPETFTECTISKPNKHSVSGSSDVWGCGCIIYEMLYGKRVFEGKKNIYNAIVDPSAKIMCPEQGKNFRVPLCFRTLVEECLIRDMSRRATVDKALSSLALTEVAVTVADMRSIINKAISLGVKTNESDREALFQFVQDEVKNLS